MPKKPFQVVKQVESLPLCPHCERELSHVYVRAEGAGFVVARNAIYFCPHCRKVLGVGASRMI